MVAHLLSLYDKMKKENGPLDEFSFNNQIDLLNRLAESSESELKGSDDEGDRSDYDMLRSYYPAWRQEDFKRALELLDRELEKRT